MSGLAMKSPCSSYFALKTDFTENNKSLSYVVMDKFKILQTYSSLSKNSLFYKNVEQTVRFNH